MKALEVSDFDPLMIWPGIMHANCLPSNLSVNWYSIQ
jgi:hypothetical protein